MDVTIGSGWSYGGPYITPDLAAARLRSDRREITPDRTSVARPVPYENDRLVAAFIGRGLACRSRTRGPSASWTSRARGRSRCPRATGRAWSSSISRATAARSSSARRWGRKATSSITTSRPADRDAPARSGRQAAGGGGARRRARDLLRQPRGLRRRLDGGHARSVPHAPRLRPAAAAPAAGARRRGPLAEICGATSAARSASSTRSASSVPLQEWSRKNNVLLRIQNYGEPPATHLQRPPRRPHRRRGMEVPRA